MYYKSIPKPYQSFESLLQDPESGVEKDGIRVRRSMAAGSEQRANVVEMSLDLVCRFGHYEAFCIDEECRKLPNHAVPELVGAKPMKTYLRVPRCTSSSRYQLNPCQPAQILLASSSYGLLMLSAYRNPDACRGAMVVLVLLPRVTRVTRRRPYHRFG